MRLFVPIVAFFTLISCTHKGTRDHAQESLRFNQYMDQVFEESLQLSPQTLTYFGRKEQADKLKAGEITQEQYDSWRDHYPRQDTTQRWSGVMSQGLSDLLLEK